MSIESTNIEGVSSDPLSIPASNTGKGSAGISALYWLAVAMQHRIKISKEAIGNDKAKRQAEVLEEAIANIKDVNGRKKLLDFIKSMLGMQIDSAQVLVLEEELKKVREIFSKHN